MRLLATAKHCAWRAVYVYLPSGRQVAYLGIDALGTVLGRIEVFGGIARRRFHFTLPGRWPWAIRSRLVNPTYWRNGRPQ